GAAGRVAGLHDAPRASGRAGGAGGSHRRAGGTRSRPRGASPERREVIMCKVMNARQVRKRPTADCVYVGRPSKWGNPFVIGRDGSRDQVIAKYGAWIVQQPSLMAALGELRGKHL